MGAMDRLGVLLQELDRASLPDLEVLALPELDAAIRAPLLARVATAAAAGPDRHEIDIAAVRHEVGDLMLRRFSNEGYRPTWAGLNWVASPMRTEDRARLIAAVQDAAVAAVLDDRLDAADGTALREPFELAGSMSGAGITGVPDLTGSRVAAAPLTVLALTAGTGGIGVIAALAAFLRRRRRRLEDHN